MGACARASTSPPFSRCSTSGRLLLCRLVDTWYVYIYLTWTSSNTDGCSPWFSTDYS